MHRANPLLAAALALAGCGSAPKCATVDAQGVVGTLGPKEQFRSMLKVVTERTQTAAMVSRRDGASAPEALAGAINAVVERRHREWEQNLVIAWGTLSSDELAQVCTALGQRDQATYMKFAERVGAEVQKRNEPLLKSAGAEVLSVIF